jgi:hypothetical protein
VLQRRECVLGSMQRGNSHDYHEGARFWPRFGMDKELSLSSTRVPGVRTLSEASEGQMSSRCPCAPCSGQEVELSLRRRDQSRH